MLAGALLQQRRHQRFIRSALLQLLRKGSSDVLSCAKSRSFCSPSSPSTDISNKEARLPRITPNISVDSLNALEAGPSADLERAIEDFLRRRDPAEPIEVSLSKAKFPFSASNLALFLDRFTSERAKDALRIVLLVMKRNPSYSLDKPILDALNRLWRHERERFSVFMATFLENRKGNFNLSLKHLMYLIRLFAWAGMVEDELAFLREYKEVHGIQAPYQHFSFVLHSCIREKRLDVALEVFQEMDQDGQMPTYESFQSLIAALLLANRIEEAGSLLVLMIARGILTLGELPPKSVNYVTVIAAFLQSADLEHARLLLLNLADVGYRPDCVTCMMVLNAFSRNGQVQAFNQLYEVMRSRGLVPSANSFKKFLRDRCWPKLNHESLEMLHAVTSALGSITYPLHDNSAMSPSTKHEKAHLTSGRIITQSDDERSEDSCFVIFDQLIYSFSMLERPHDAYEILLEMLECSEGMKFPTATTSMLLFDALVSKSGLEKAENLLRLMLKWGHMPSMKVLNRWVQGLCNAENVDKAYKFLDECNVEDLVLDAMSYTMMINALCLEGRLHEAKKITNEVRRDVGTPDAVNYCKMIQSFAKAGDIEVPLRLLAEMVDMGVTPFALPFTPLINNLCVSNKTKEALALLDEIESKGCRPLPSLYTLIVRTRCECNDMNGAFEVMDIMKSKGVTPEPQAHRLLFGGCMASQRSSKGIVQARFSGDMQLH